MSPGDIVIADINGVIIVPQDRVEEVLEQAGLLMDEEEQMKTDLLAGMDVLEVDRKYNYEQMLKK